MGAFVLGIPEHRLRVVAPDVGGGFGSKIFHYAEEAFVTLRGQGGGAAGQVDVARGRRPSSPTPTAATTSPRSSLPLDEDGKFLALRTDTLANMGAYLSTFAPCIPTYLHGTLMAGNYATPLIYVNVKAVFTNTVPVDAYRGAGRPEATFQLERVIDKAARELGIDPVEIRRRNFVKPDQFPYQTPVAVHYDTGDYHATLDKLLEMSDRAGLRGAAAGERRRAASCAASASAAYIEACGIAPSSLVGQLGARAGLYESATVRVNADRQASRVFTGSHSHGQGHETTFPQVVASMLGIDEKPDRHRARRHRADPVRHGHLRLALAGGRRVGDRQGDGEDHRQGEEDRRAPDGGVRRRRRAARTGEFTGRGHRQVGGLDRRDAGGLRAAQLSDRGAGAGAGGDGVLRSGELHLSRPAPMPARWRSIPRPARWRWWRSPPRTISATW